MRIINSPQELEALRVELDCRLDWHEPDEQEVTVTFAGYRFDNAESAPWENEMGIFIHQSAEQGDDAVAWVNLATLISWACEAGR